MTGSKSSSHLLWHASGLLSPSWDWSLARQPGSHFIAKYIILYEECIKAKILEVLVSLSQLLNHYQRVEGPFSSLACHLHPSFCFFALLPQRVLSKSQDYPGEMAHAEKNLAARHSRGRQLNHRIYKNSFQPVLPQNILGTILPLFPFHIPRLSDFQICLP